MTLLAFCDKFPPYLVRLCARKGRGHKRLTCREIARAGGVSKSFVARVAVRLTWKGLALEEVDKFCKGCGVDLFHTGPHKRFLKESKWSFMFNDRRARRYHSRLMLLK